MGLVMEGGIGRAWGKCAAGRRGKRDKRAALALAGRLSLSFVVRCFVVRGQEKEKQRVDRGKHIPVKQIEKKKEAGARCPTN